MSETPNTQATPGTPAELSTPAAVTLAAGTLLSRLRRRLKSSAPNPCASPPSSLKATESAPRHGAQPQPAAGRKHRRGRRTHPAGMFGLRAWRFADGAEHISARALDRDGTPYPPRTGSARGTHPLRMRHRRYFRFLPMRLRYPAGEWYAHH